MAKYNILRDNDDLPKKKDDIENRGFTEQPEKPSQEPPSIPASEEETKESSVEEFFNDEIFTVPKTESTPPQIDIINEEDELEPPGDQDGFDISTPAEDKIPAPEADIASFDSKIPQMVDDLPAVDESVPPFGEDPLGIDESTPALEDEQLVVDEQMSGIEEKSKSDYPPPEEQKPRYYDYDEDDTQDKMNYKPILIGITTIAAIVILYFVVSNVFFSESEVAEEQVVETAAEKLQREQAERKQNFLANVNKLTNHRMKAINLLNGLKNDNVRYSSILLYGNSLDLEIFAPDRDALAKFNQKIKNNNRIKEFKIESVHNRPGSEGGLFALYDIDLKKIVTTAGTSRNIISISPASWSSTAPKQAGLSINSQRQVSTRNENLFKVNRYEYELKGSFKNCVALINQLATASQNIEIRKLALLPTDQRKMSTSSYLIKLVIDFYI